MVLVVVVVMGDGVIGAALVLVIVRAAIAHDYSNFLSGTQADSTLPHISEHARARLHTYTATPNLPSAACPAFIRCGRISPWATMEVAEDGGC